MIFMQKKESEMLSFFAVLYAKTPKKQIKVYIIFHKHSKRKECFEFKNRCLYCQKLLWRDAFWQ